MQVNLRIIAAVILFLSQHAHASWFEDSVIEYAVGDLGISEFKEDNGDMWGIWYGGPLKPSKCLYLEYKLVEQCLVAFTGSVRLLDMRTAYPQCFKDDKDMPRAVKVRCVELNPFVVASSIFGSKDLYEIDPIVAWHQGGRVGTIPMNKIGKVASGTVCEPVIVLMVGEDVVGISTNTNGLRGAVRCK